MCVIQQWGANPLELSQAQQAEVDDNNKTLQDMKIEVVYDSSRFIEESIKAVFHTIVEAINRQLTHYSYHVGQIVFLAKHLRSSDWKTLSVPKNRSAEFNQYLADKQVAGEAETNRMESSLEFAKKEGK